MSIKGTKSSAFEQRQKLSNTSFLPFAADVMTDLTIRPRRTSMLPLHLPEALTKEAVDAVSEVVRRGVILFLVRQGGWQPKRWTRDGKERLDPAARLLGHLADQGIKLKYTDKSLDAMLCAYNAMAYLGGARQSKKASQNKLSYSTRASSTKYNGDLLTHYILGHAIRNTHYHFERIYSGYFERNPLAKFIRFDMKDQKEATEIVERLWAPDFEPFMPWLVPHIVKMWHKALQSRWNNLEQFSQLAQGMGWTMSALVKLSEKRERREMLIAPMQFFAGHFSKEEVEEQWLAEFRALTKSLRLADRDSYKRQWASGLWPAWTVWSNYQEARQTPPIDRLGADTIFMEAMETSFASQTAYEQVAWRARSFSEQLESVIS